mmetsp:Transcript_13598/g.40128  ORF Transcript_13598/g.40128 Transcript_13598/m.40128 type:complete len:230 (-) Transcript_13598:138-827(-)
MRRRSDSSSRAAAASPRSAQSTSVSLTFPNSDTCTAARGFIAAVMERSVVSSSALFNWSALLRMITSAVSTCSTRSSTTLRWVFDTPSSSPSSGRSFTFPAESKRSTKVLASTTVTRVSRTTLSMSSSPTSMARLKMLRISLGSATPVDSTTMWSYGAPRFSASSTSLSMDCMNSSAIEQHAQPFCSSTVSSAADVPPPTPLTSFASMFTSATSFTTTPTLRPSLFCSR